jgi:hypothetical protein
VSRYSRRSFDWQVMLSFMKQRDKFLHSFPFVSPTSCSSTYPPTFLPNHLRTCLSIYVSVCLYLYIYIYMCIYPYLRIYLSVYYPTVWLHRYLLINKSVDLPISLHIHLFVRQSVRLSVCVPIHISLVLFVSDLLICFGDETVDIKHTLRIALSICSMNKEWSIENRTNCS